MFQPPEDLDVILGVQKYQVSGLLYIGNFHAAEKEIQNALRNDATPSIAIVCCTTYYRTDKTDKTKSEQVKKEVEESNLKIDTAIAQGKIKRLDIGFADAIPTDETKELLKQSFQEAYTFIDDAIKNNIPVLVHCDNGSTRSATLIVAYLMRSTNLTFAEAEKRVLTVRGTVQDVNWETQQSIRVNYANINNFRDFLADREREFHVLVPPVAQPIQPSLRLPPGYESIANADAKSDTDMTTPPKLFEYIFQAENRLDAIVKTMGNRHENKSKAYNDIYNIFHNLYSGYSEPINKFNVSELQTKLSDMTQLFHTLLHHKDKIDLHKHSTIDLFLFKDKSASWQLLIEMIRKDALTLISRINLLMFRDRFPNEEIVKYLTTQRNNPLFCLHRGNHWYEKFGDTTAVKYINSLIAERENKSPHLNKV